MKTPLLILALFAFPILPAGAAEPTFDLQAHRGGKTLCPPGNILPAFRKALNLKVTTLELDTHITRDGEIIIIHDPGVLEKAISKPTQTHGYRIRKHALSEIKQYVIRAGEGKTATVPTLEEFFLFLKAYPDAAETPADARQNAREIRLNIETKEQGYEDKLVTLIKSHGLEKRAVIQSFKMASLVKVTPTPRYSPPNPSSRTTLTTLARSSFDPPPPPAPPAPCPGPRSIPSSCILIFTVSSGFVTTTCDRPPTAPATKSSGTPTSVPDCRSRPRA